MSKQEVDANNDYDDSDEDDVDLDEVEAPLPTKPKALSGISGLKVISHGNQQKQQEEQNAQGEDCTVIFQLPSGEAKKHTVRTHYNPFF